MKERPIIFNSEMVRAILNGRKTQTRRVIKPQPHIVKPISEESGFKNEAWEKTGLNEYTLMRCKYGLIGDYLWVRETFQIDDNYPDMVFYKADDLAGHISTKWNSPIYMPRCDSRITLEITNIRVERLKDISLRDMMREGLFSHEPMLLNEYFCNLWDSINKKRGYGWGTNPYVWAIEFKRISQ